MTFSWMVKLVERSTVVKPVVGATWVMVKAADAMGATPTDVARSSNTAPRQATALTESALTLMSET